MHSSSYGDGGQAPYTDGPTAHRDARTVPTGPPRNGAPQPPMYAAPRRRSRIPLLAVGAYAAGLLGCVIAGVALAMFLVYKSQGQSQIHELQQALTRTQSTLAKAQSDNATKYTKLSGTISTIENTVSPYNMICSNLLMGANGPAQFWFACTSQKP
jgi:hypothetical protein